MAHHAIKRGLDIPIAGAASGAPVPLDRPGTIALDPRELKGFTPRLAARAGDEVRKGQPILFHKFDPEIALVAPVAGRIAEIRRGRRRVITAVVIEVADGATVEHRAWTVDELASIPRDQAKQQVLAGGMWPFLRTRPLDQVPATDVVPQAVVICGTESGPAMPGAASLLSSSDKPALQAAVHVLRALTDGTVHVTASGPHEALDGLTGVEAHTFTGPHPSGDPGVQINHLCPPRGAGRVWYIRAWDAVALGRLFLDGQFFAERIYAAVGAGVSSPRLVKTIIGAPVAGIVGATTSGNVRWIRGSVLTGVKVEPDSHAGIFSRAIHVLLDDVERELFGWAMPQLAKWSAHKAYLAGFMTPSSPVDLRPGLFGGHRAIVPINAYDDVVATPDIVATFLFKSIIAGDLEESIKLGLLDITLEEAALCSFVCPSKLDWDVLLTEGLDLYVQEA